MEIREARGAFEIHGDTYLVRDVLKGHGGRWNGFAGAWTFASRPEADDAMAAAQRDLAFKQEMAEMEAA